MEYLSQVVNIPILQALGVVLLIGVAERIGIPIISIFKGLLKMNGNGDQKVDVAVIKEKLDEQKEFNREMKEHARISNSEVGEIKDDISELKTNVAVIKKTQENNTDVIRQIAQDVKEIRNEQRI